MTTTQKVREMARRRPEGDVMARAILRLADERDAALEMVKHLMDALAVATPHREAGSPLARTLEAAEVLVKRMGG